MTSQHPVPLNNRSTQSRSNLASTSNSSTHKSEYRHAHNLDNEHQPIQGQPHTHIHSEESLKQIVNRLSRIEGHVRGIKTMVNESRPCPEVLVQIAAIRGALDRVARLILDEHLSECIGRAVTNGNIEAEMEELKTALDRFLS